MPVLLLCYTSIGETCILILAWKTIYGTNGTYYGWHNDPTIQYGQGFHGLLVFVAVILILVYILPFSIGLLLPPLILRTRLSIMLKPLLDAFWNPFKPKFRFWIGLRALVRIVPFCFAVFTPFPTNCILLVAFIVPLHFLHVCIQPYEGKVQNVLDSFFYFSINLLTACVLYFNIVNVEYLAFLSAVNILSYLGFFFIVVLHINIRFPVIRETANKLYQRLRLKVKKQKDNNNNITALNLVAINALQNESETTFTDLRESLLDSDLQQV